MTLEHELQVKKFRSEAHKLIVNLIFTSSWLKGKMDAAMVDSDITHQQYNILRILNGSDPNPVSVKAIRERMIERGSDVSRIIDRMLVKGLVNRFECKHDRRNVDIMITEMGKERLSYYNTLIEPLDKLMETLNLEQQQTLNSLLEKLRQ